MWDNDDNRFSEQDLADFAEQEDREGEQAQADQLDAERDAYHAAQDALEQVWLGEVYEYVKDDGKAFEDDPVCTCGAVATFHNPAHFYCVCDL